MFYYNKNTFNIFYLNRKLWAKKLDFKNVKQCLFFFILTLDFSAMFDIVDYPFL